MGLFKVLGEKIKDEFRKIGEFEMGTYPEEYEQEQDIQGQEKEKNQLSNN